MVRNPSPDALSELLLKWQPDCRAMIAVRLKSLLDGYATPDHHCQNIVRVAVAIDESA